MKKFLVLIASLVLATSLMAEPNAGSSKFTFSGGVGSTRTGGTIDASSFTSGDAKSAYPLAYEFGFSYAYYIMQGGGIVASAIYNSTPLKLQDKSDKNETLTLKSEFLDLGLGVRKFTGDIFYGGGLYYGMAVGKNWKAVSEPGNLQGITAQGTNKSPFGIYLEAGYALPVAKDVSLDLGIKVKRAITYVYKDDTDKLNYLALSATLGLTFGF